LAVVFRLHGPADSAGGRGVPTHFDGSCRPHVSKHSAAALLLSDWWNLQADVEHEGRGKGDVYTVSRKILIISAKWTADVCLTVCLCSVAS